MLEKSGSSMSIAQKKDQPERRRTGRGPRMRIRREGVEPEIIVFPDDADGIEVLEQCFREAGKAISDESAARCDEVLRRRAGKQDQVADRERLKKTRWKR